MVHRKGQAILGATQLVLMFAMGIFGSSLASHIHLRAQLLIVIGGVIVLGLFIVQLRLQRASLDVAPSPSPGDVPALRLKGRWLLSRTATVFSLGILTGMVVAAISIALGPQGYFLRSLRIWGGPNNYELVGFAVAVVLAYALSRQSRNLLILLSGGLGYGVAFAGTESVLRPNENAFLLSLAGWLVATGTVSFLLSRLRTSPGELVRRLAEFFKSEPSDH